MLTSVETVVLVPAVELEPFAFASSDRTHPAGTGPEAVGRRVPVELSLLESATVPQIFSAERSRRRPLSAVAIYLPSDRGRV